MSKKKQDVPVAASPLEPKPLVKLDIASRGVVPEGFVKLADALTFPWPYANASISEAFSSYHLCLVPGKLRGRWMDELYRVLIPGGKATIVLPYWAANRSVQDFMYEWPPFVEASFLYFNKEWRERENLQHYPVTCDFDFGYGYGLDQDVANRNEEVRAFWFKHYIGAINDLQIVLTRRPNPVL